MTGLGNCEREDCSEGIWCKDPRHREAHKGDAADEFVEWLKSQLIESYLSDEKWHLLKYKIAERYRIELDPM